MPRVTEQQIEELGRAFNSGTPVVELRSSFNLGTRALVQNLMRAHNKGFISDEAIARFRVGDQTHT